MTSRLATLLAGTLLFSAASLTASAPASAALTPGLPGPHNAITDVPGIQVGQVQSTQSPYLTGTTVVYAPKMAVTGVDQRGGAPATKETDLLNPLNSNPGVNAVMLGGSSMYGLAATDGVIRWLEERGEGIRVGAGVAPIVPAADIFDLGRGGDFKARTTPEWGYLAASAAGSGPVRQGVVGGGTGARAGGLKSGVGTASVALDNGVVVGAIVVVNSAGSPVDPRDCSLYAARFELADEYGALKTPRPDECRPAAAAADAPQMNTTIAVVATNAPLEKAAAARMAGNAHDGMARAISPIHTLADGDTVFGMSTGTGTPLRVNNPADGGQLNRIFNAAADTLSRAIGHALLAATSVGTTTSYCDRYPSACPGDLRSAYRQGAAPAVTGESLRGAAAKLAAVAVPAAGGSGGGDASTGAVTGMELKSRTSDGSGGNSPVTNGLLAGTALAALVAALWLRHRRSTGTT